MITAAFVTHCARLSGAELFVRRITAAMSEVRPVVVLGEHGPLEQQLEQAGVECHVLPLSAGVRDVPAVGVRGLDAVRAFADTTSAVLRLHAWLRRRGVDLVITHSAKAHVYAGVAARAARVPVVMHAHDVVGAGGGRVTTAVLRAAFRALPHSVVANSVTTQSSLPRAAATRSTVIGCPAEAVRVPPIGSRAHRFVVVGRLAEWKGQDVAIRAFAEARRRGLPGEATLTLYGTAAFVADQGYAASLPALARSLGIGGAVSFAGHVDSLETIYGSADVVLHTSIRPEPFGQVVVEAMSARRPVVATAAGGPAEVVTDGVDGLLVPSADVDALAGAMVRLANDEALRAALVEAGSETVSRFAPAQVVAAIERVLLDAARSVR